MPSPATSAAGHRSRSPRLPLLKQKIDRAFLDSMLRLHAESLERVGGAYTSRVETMRPIHPEYVAAQLDELADDDAVFTVDTGMCNVWATRYLTPNGRRRMIGSFRHGSMANALPHAIGAQFGAPGRQVVSMSGDGGLTMLLGELITVRLHRLPVKLEMMVDGIPDFQTDHEPTNFAAIADRRRHPGDPRRGPQGSPRRARRRPGPTGSGARNAPRSTPSSRRAASPASDPRHKRRPTPGPPGGRSGRATPARRGFGGR